MRKKFITLLEKRYGPWDRNKALFGNIPYGRIAKDLSISSSQFSKLLYGSATEGMYERTLDNINRLIEHENLKHSYQRVQQNLKNTNRVVVPRLIIIAFITFLLGGMASLFFFNKNEIHTSYNIHPLEHYFNLNSDEFFDSPYLNENDVSDFCPCSGFEGRWKMVDQFKLPLPGTKKPGLFYKAKSSDLVFRCTNLLDPYVKKGNAIIGYEHLISEIWIDIERESLVPRFFDIETKRFTKEFDNISFETLSNFKKVADLSAFNVNIFEINGDSIYRKAELSGRYAIDINETLTERYNIDIDHITKNILGDLTKTNCEVTYNPYCNPNDLEEGSVISFDCNYTIGEENLGLKGGYPYTKGFKLIEQVYSDYIACSCQENLNE